MKWVVGSVAVLVALVIGVAIGWKLRGGEVAYYQHLLAPSRSPSPSPPPPSPLPTVTAGPTTTTARPHVWIEAPETFAWPTSASDDVVVVDPTHYLVKRAFFVKVTALDTLGTVRVLPRVVDGGANGVAVYGVRADSNAAKLGLKNGDTLVTVNGTSLATAEDAVEAQSHTHDGKNFVLVLERRGAPLELHYHVLD